MGDKKASRTRCHGISQSGSVDTTVALTVLFEQSDEGLVLLVQNKSFALFSHYFHRLRSCVLLRERNHPH